jgi:peptide chain release factor 1
MAGAGRNGLGMDTCSSTLPRMSTSPPIEPLPPPSSACPDAEPRVLAKLAQLECEERGLASLLEDPAVLADHRRLREISLKRSALKPAAEAFRELVRLDRDASEMRAAIVSGSDRELIALANDELPTIRERAREILRTALSRLVNAEDEKVGSVMLEVRAGTGGDEAALWASDLLAMYQKYAVRRGWSWELLDAVSETGAGGIRSAVVNVRGPGAWSELAFEAGVHSVKRVPATEAAGRVHTSTASVAVLPEPEDVDVKIDWAAEVEEFATRAQGPGGQNVNKVETAWQIHHKPTGIIIKMMEAKSQQQNRERARRLLMARLHELERTRKNAERSAARASQIGTAGRSEKIRTYRYKDGIVADERLPGEYQIRTVIAGDLGDLMRDLSARETARRVAEL